jgi:hypothetical protein
MDARTFRADTAWQLQGQFLVCHGITIASLDPDFLQTASRIVETLNSHSELRDACKLARGQCGKLPDDPAADNLVRVLDAAIAKAEGK